jgi:hypothetical protein
MTPQERQLVDELFDRMAQLENAPREPEAERLIADGARRSPNSLYALVQTVLVQDKALKRANARIEELQAQLGAGEEPERQGGFLDSMRDALGLGEPRGSVPRVRAAGGAQSQGNQPQGGILAANASTQLCRSPGLRHRWVIPRHGGLDRGGRHRRRHAAQRHPLDVRSTLRLRRTERVRKPRRPSFPVEG